MRITYDPRADAAYFYLAKKVDRPETLQVDDDINLDFDAHGRLVGVEVLDASKRLVLDALLPECEILGAMEEKGWYKLRGELLRHKQAGLPLKAREQGWPSWVEEVGVDYLVLRGQPTGNRVKITRDELENRDIKWHKENHRLGIVEALWDLGGYG